MKFPCSLPRPLLSGLLGCLFTATCADDGVALRNWPAWRGPASIGTAPLADPPVTWSETRHLRWKVAVPGQGSASPIVWEDKVFVLTAIPADSRDGVGKTPDAGAPPGTPATAAAAAGRETAMRAMVEQPTEAKRFVVLALDRATGRVRWQKTLRTELPHESHHKDHGYASASPATDGDVLIASFGSHGLYGLDLAGNVLWSRDFGRMRTRNGFGEASSPTLPIC